MATSTENLADLVGGLSISDNTPRLHGQQTLQEAVRILVSSAEVTLTHAQSVQSLIGDTGILSSPHITETWLLQKKATELANISRVLDDTANKLGNAIEHSVVAHLSSLGAPGGVGFQLQGLLKHFDGQIRHIARDVLSNSTDDDRVLCKISEECYNQATSTSGKLDYNNYLGQREAARLAMSEENTRERQSWIHFWVDVLDRCPGGPTLFYPRAKSDVECFSFDLSDIPQYLFRTFDQSSSGRNDTNVIASTANSRIDILSLKQRKATEMLHAHLTKPCFGVEDFDNLVSWTSSLLFAIQYAIWRCHKLCCDPVDSDVTICVVDTRNFPRGQFAQDMWLLQTYRETAEEVGGKTRRFFQFRQEDERYHNGEYLSQGSLDLSGRSCVVSLQSLIKTGLYKLYPEFAEPYGMEKWAKRVLELRRRWGIGQTTTHEEIEQALEIARKCFNGFEVLDMALMLLTFKSRKYQPTTPTGGGDIKADQHVPEWGRRPDEVRRYLVAVRTTKLREQSNNGFSPDMFRRLNVRFAFQMLQETFQCL